MLHTAGDMLRTSRAEVEHVNGADTPGVVVAVLPVEEAILPDPSIIVPLARSIAVGISKLVDFVMPAATTRLIIHIIWHQGVADDSSHRHTAGYHYGVATDARPVVATISQCKPSLYGEIHSPTRPATVGVGASQEGARRPSRGVLHVAVAVWIACNSPAGIEVGTMIEGECRNENIDDGPYRALQKQQEDMPNGIFEEAPREHVNPRPHTFATLFVIGWGQNLEEQVIDARDAMDENVVDDGIGKPQRRGGDVHHHRYYLRYHSPRRLTAVRRPVLLEEIAPWRYQKMFQTVEKIDGRRDDIVSSEEASSEKAT